ncbi:hypothetical protein [Antiquaquibacter soli]|uniref:Uncharacterized protein n=1 Tax=Antiquaquibacter soli TaxID=3064523 RepID=A0ABT9BJX3_9MICO|nr:hypothetical protein [Protaetiibacter sp. WY-16]MDO7881316.1 hypothetical protein [Protaetiibacter sp. WY-16]
MRRFTRSIAVLLLAAPLAACSTAQPASLDHHAGRYGPGEPIILDNLTLAGGRYVIDVQLDLFVRVVGPPVSMSCSIIDATGQLGPLFGTGFTAGAGDWFSISSTSTFELPETTLGLRCSPDRPAVLDVLVREADLSAQRQG